jgi:hypothetical protein
LAGVGDVIRNIQAERDGDGDGDVSTPADGGGGFSPASRKSSRAKSEAAAPLSRHGDQDVNLVESTGRGPSISCEISHTGSTVILTT